MVESDEDSWCEIEDVLRRIVADCIIEIRVTRKLVANLKVIYKGVGLPNLVIAYINSVLIAGIMKDIMNPQALSLTTCFLAMASGILQSVLAFLKVPERLETATKLHMELQALKCSIEVMLAMPPEFRQIAPGKYVADCAEKYQHLITTAEIRPVNPSNGSITSNESASPTRDRSN